MIYKVWRTLWQKRYAYLLTYWEKDHARPLRWELQTADQMYSICGRTHTEEKLFSSVHEICDNECIDRPETWNYIEAKEYELVHHIVFQMHQDYHIRDKEIARINRESAIQYVHQATKNMRWIEVQYKENNKSLSQKDMDDVLEPLRKALNSLGDLK